MTFSKAMLKLVILQCVVAILAVLVVTAVRFFDSEVFSKFIEEYRFFATFDTDISLVYGGK